MVNLQKLIEQEGNANKFLKRAYEEQDFNPTPTQVGELGIEDLFKLSRESVDFVFQMEVRIHSSNTHLIKLMQAYLSDSDSYRDSSYEADVRLSLPQLEQENEMIIGELRKRFMAGYEASW
ncbi:MAG: hypothetical protein AABX11_01105 [Nanoarchaeota archaeon]